MINLSKTLFDNSFWSSMFISTKWWRMGPIYKQAAVREREVHLLPRTRTAVERLWVAMPRLPRISEKLILWTCIYKKALRQCSLRWPTNSSALFSLRSQTKTNKMMKLLKRTLDKLTKLWQAPASAQTQLAMGRLETLWWKIQKPPLTISPLLIPRRNSISW